MHFFALFQGPMDTYIQHEPLFILLKTTTDMDTLK